MAKLDKVIIDIKKALKEDNRGLTIEELSKIARTSRITASMALMKLEGMGQIYVRPIGNCKLHYLNLGGKK